MNIANSVHSPTLTNGSPVTVLQENDDEPTVIFYGNVTEHIREIARLEAELVAAADTQVLLAVAWLVIVAEAAVIVGLVAVLLAL